MELLVLLILPFLSDPSPIIGNACQWLTDSCLVSLIDMTLVCEDAHSKLIEVFTVADVESCWQQFVADLEAEVWS